MTTLDGSAIPVDLGGGYALRAPGLEGTVDTREARPPRTRGGGDEQATEALDDALAATDMNEIRSIVIDVAAHRPVSADARVRTAGGEDAMVLDVPDLGPTVGQVVMAIDEDGTISWHHPVDRAGHVETSATRGSGNTKTFVIRATSPAPAADPGTRSLLGGLGKKVLKVLIYPIADTVLQTAARFFARKWEERYRPYGVRWFRPGDYATSDGPPISSDDWQILDGGRSLLFLHGTFSRSFSAFSGLPVDTMRELDRRYDGRVFAFDHFSLSHDPERNLVELLDRIPGGTSLDIDIVSHSRGGLVARAIAGETSLGPISQIDVGKSVFVAAPNHGTVLADAEHMSAFLDRYTSILNLIPPGPHSVVVDILESVVTAVKMVGCAALDGLPGLTAMDPGGDFITHMNAGVPTAAAYYGICANYEPTGGLAALVADGVVDRVFRGAANDLVVPTVGVYSGSDDPAFPIPADRVVEFATDRAISHNDFFSKPATNTTLLDWLSP